MAAQKSKRLFGNVHPAIIVVWAAIIAASGLLPGIPLMGVGGVMSVTTALLPLAGIMFGPVAGTLSAAIGCFIGQLIAPATAVLGVWSFLIGTVNALLAGLYWERKNWFYVLGYCALTIVLWLSHPIGRSAWIFAVLFHGTGLVTAIVSCIFGRKWLLGKNVVLKTIVIFLMCYSSIVMAAAGVDYLAIILWATPAITWKLLAFTAPVERLFFAIAATIVGVPLMMALPKVGVLVGPRIEEEEEEEEEEAEAE